MMRTGTRSGRFILPVAAALFHHSSRFLSIQAFALDLAVATHSTCLSAAASPSPPSVPPFSSSPPPLSTTRPSTILSARSSAATCGRQLLDKAAPPIQSEEHRLRRSGRSLSTELPFLFAAAVPSEITGAPPNSMAVSPSSDGADSAALAGGVRTAFVTAPDSGTAEKIASKLVSQKAAACVNIIPGLTSVYEWEGKIEKESEVLLMVKTTREKFADMQKIVLETHPYDCPEVIGFDVAAGSDAYLQWVQTVVRGGLPPAPEKNG